MTCLGGRLARTRQPGRYAGQSCLQCRQLRNNLLLGGDAFGRSHDDQRTPSILGDLIPCSSVVCLIRVIPCFFVVCLIRGPSYPC